MNQITISFANGGFVLEVAREDNITVEVFVSQGKLIKAARAAIDELSLLPKKSGDEAAE